MLQEALKRFPAQYELSLALLESLHHLGCEEAALNFAASLPERVRNQGALPTRLKELQVSIEGMRPPAAVRETLLRLHEQGDFEALEGRLPDLLQDYPRWNFGQTLLASSLFMSMGQMLTTQTWCLPSAVEPVQRTEASLRERLRAAMSAARQRVKQQINIAITRSPENAHARELLIRTRFEEGEAIESSDLAHIGAQVQSTLIGPFLLASVHDKNLPEGVEVHHIEPASITEIPAPRSVGSQPLNLTGAIGPALLCARYVCEAAGATVCAGSDVVLLPNGRALSDNLTHPLGELVNHHFDEWIAMGAVSQLVLRKFPTESMPGTVISLLGAATRFYGHWLFDTLIRFRSLEGHPAAATASLLVEEDMPDTHIQALQLLLGPGRVIHRVAKGRCVSAERVLLAGPEVFFPHAVRNGAPSLPSVAPSAIGGLTYLRARMHAAVGSSRARRSSRLMVRRRSSTRRVVNEDLLSEMLVGEWGFEELYPETLSFTEQVHRFREADVVVGAQGSAMSNCVFCTPGARVVSLCSTFAANFPSWANALEHLGVRHCFVVGETVADSHSLAIQRDIHVDPMHLLEALHELGMAAAL